MAKKTNIQIVWPLLSSHGLRCGPQSASLIPLLKAPEWKLRTDGFPRGYLQCQIVHEINALKSSMFSGRSRVVECSIWAGSGAQGPKKPPARPICGWRPLARSANILALLDLPVAPVDRPLAKITRRVPRRGHKRGWPVFSSARSSCKAGGPAGRQSDDQPTKHSVFLLPQEPLSATRRPHARGKRRESPNQRSSMGSKVSLMMPLQPQTHRIHESFRLVPCKSKLRPRTPCLDNHNANQPATSWQGEDARRA